MEHLVAQWISSYGSLALFGLLVLGVFGAPVPDETLLVIAGTLVSKHELGTRSTYGAAFLGSVVGITLSYVVGRVVGIQVLTRYGRHLHLTPSQIERARHWFERTGKWALLIGYFVPGLRHVTAICAGASNMTPSIFATFAYSGALLWSASFISVGWYAGDQWEAVVRTVHARMLLAGAVALATTLATMIGIRLTHGFRKGRQQ